MTTLAAVPTTPTVALRPATETDRLAVRRLAALDSAVVPSGPLLLAVVDGQARAAISLTTDEVIADPFTPTAAVVELLVLRAARLRAARLRHETGALGRVRRARDRIALRRRQPRASAPG